MTSKVTIQRLATGVPGLDEVLGGGLPEFSFNLIAGQPGCGKTIRLRRVTAVVKVRASAHSDELREYTIDADRKSVV